MIERRGLSAVFSVRYYPTSSHTSLQPEIKRKSTAMAEGGQQFGKYRILEELGRGGFATVYKAIDTTLDREVALKVLDPLLTRDPAFISRFRQEAKVTARLFHP